VAKKKYLSGGKSFPGGAYPNASKYYSEDEEISLMPAPKTVYIPVVQDSGGVWAKREIVVQAGQAVKKGQVIATITNWNTANVHSSVSGIVKGIEKRSNPNGIKIDHIVIENDGKEDEVLLPILNDPSADEIIERVKEAGVVGLGGAGFPTHVKLKPPSPVDSLLINAAECEPYITCDDRIMQDLTEKFVEGVKLMAKALGVEKIYIGIEVNKPDAYHALKKYETENFILVKLKKKYPQGAEKQLLYASLRRKVPVGKFPGDVGAIITNVHTALSVYLAVKEGKASYERVTTITGGGVTRPANIWIRNGTPLEEVLAHCGGIKEGEQVVKIIAGGPMMGSAMIDLEPVASKLVSNVIFMTPAETFTDKPTQCISCRKCISICPMILMPVMIDDCVEFEDYAGAKAYHVNACIECGCCAYICPAKRALITSMRIAKDKIWELGL